MTETMNWKECFEKNIITKTTPDFERAQQLKKMADIRFEFWNKPTSDKFISLKIEAYYEIIKELILTHLYEKGYNCKNHICLIAYLREKFKDFDYQTQKIDELRQIRNEITYRGFTVKKDYLQRNELEFKSIIKEIKEKISQQIRNI